MAKLNLYQERKVDILIAKEILSENRKILTLERELTLHRSLNGKLTQTEKELKMQIAEHKNEIASLTEIYEILKEK